MQICLSIKIINYSFQIFVQYSFMVIFIHICLSHLLQISLLR